MKIKLLSLNLRLFDGDGGGDAGQAAAGAPGGAPASTSSDDAAAALAALDSEFEALIKGKYKDQYAKRFQKGIDTRFKETKGLQEWQKSYGPIVALAEERYGVKNDPGKLLDSFKNDKAYMAELEEKAIEAGIPVETYSELQELRKFREQAEQRQIQDEMDQLFARWYNESEEMKNIFPGFDLVSELGNPQFEALLRNGVTVEGAFRALHYADIDAGLVKHAVDTTKKQVTDDILARGARPAENGASGFAPGSSKLDPKSMTPAQREEINRRAAKGEHITFR